MTAFRPIIGFNGKYMINNNGDVISYVYKTPRKLKRNLNSGGYEYYKLHDGNKFKNFLVHKLVAEHFLFIKSDKVQINHIDGNKTNNNVSNLEYVTASENIKHAYKSGLMTNVLNALTKSNSKILVDTQTGIFYNSIKEASELLNIDYSRLMNMVGGTQKNKTNLIYA